MLAPSLSLGGLSWVLETPPGPSSLASAGLRVQNFLPNLDFAVSPQESGSPLKQNGRLDYHEGTEYYIFEPTLLFSEGRGWLGGVPEGRGGQANDNLLAQPLPVCTSCWQQQEDPHLLLGRLARRLEGHIFM